MKVKDLMTKQVISIHPDESVAVAARSLASHNIGVLPVCDHRGQVCGVLTDRDIVTRCVSTERPPSATTVRQIMTGRVLSVRPDMDAAVAAHLMGREQVRRLPVVDETGLCGMVSLGDLAAREDSVMDAADALSDIASNIAVEKDW